MARSGWHNESYRHFLAAKGVRTGRGFFVGKGNKESGVTKSLLAKPLKDAEGNILRDPLTGRPMYPTKEMLGIPRAPKPESVNLNDPLVRAKLEQEIVGLQQKYATQQPAGSFIPPTMAVQEQLAPEPLPQAPMATPEPSELKPEMPVDISDNVDAELSAVRDYNAFDTAIATGENRVPLSELHVTPSVPPEPTSILQDSAGMQP